MNANTPGGTNAVCSRNRKIIRSHEAVGPCREVCMFSQVERGPMGRRLSRGYFESSLWLEAARGSHPKRGSPAFRAVVLRGNLNSRRKGLSDLTWPEAPP